MGINMKYYKEDLYKENYEYPISMNGIKKNILNWYPFKENATILQIGGSSKEITNYLCNICKKVTIIEFSKEKVNCIYSKEEEQKNLEIIVGNLENINLQEKFDYILMLGTLEYANIIMKNEKEPEYELINYCKDRISEDGTILIAVDNKIGVKYLAGGKSKHCEKVYDSIKNRFHNGKLFSKRELEELIEKVGIKNKRYFYPLPNYEVPNLIISQEALVKSTDSKLNYNCIYEEGSLVVQDEIKLLKQFINNNEFEEYTNSYLVELSNTEINRNMKYVSFNNMRKDKYSLILKMFDEAIEKTIKEDLAKEHILQIKENIKILKELGFEIAEDEQTEDNCIKSRYIHLPQLDQYIVKQIENNQIDEAYMLIDTWYGYIQEKLKADENGNIEYGFVDLVFENVFYDELNKKFIIFDQEWLQKNINMDFILYRSINNLFAHHSKIEQKLNKEYIMQKYGLIEKQEEYNEKEMNFQAEIIDEEKRKFYGEQYKYKISSEEILKIIEDLKRLDRDNAQLIKEIERLRNENKEDKVPEKESTFTKIKQKMLGK